MMMRILLLRKFRFLIILTSLFAIKPSVAESQILSCQGDLPQVSVSYLSNKDLNSGIRVGNEFS